MKKIFTPLLLFQTSLVFAQGGPGDYDASKIYSAGYGIVGLNASGMMESFDASGKRIPSNNQLIAGTKMLSDEFILGTVKLNGIEKPANLMVNFSLYNNQLFFKKDSLFLAFVNPVEEFTILMKENNINKIITFKSGYPAVGNNTDKSLYQVVSDGPKVQLLKYMYKVVQDKVSYNGPVQREWAYRENFYLYDVEKKTMTTIRPSVKSITKSNPMLSASVENYAARFKMKNEEDLVGWVASINDIVPAKKK
ncbi:MAG: hypothetical protein HYR66_09120 [Sphingobacteriales bacterium]|nr:hypothetical protein [Sphingobacteriales bacterium]MBI3720141.1 hypothetical protein [Sphingobacteriales bacterium]